MSSKSGKEKIHFGKGKGERGKGKGERGKGKGGNVGAGKVGKLKDLTILTMAIGIS